MSDKEGYVASVTLTRTADTNVYAAGDVIGAATGSSAALTFSQFGQAGRVTMITGASLVIDSTGVIAGETSYTLYLYSVTPPSALGDNVAFDLPSGDRASFLGSISLGTPADIGSSLYIETSEINKMFQGGGTVYGYLVTVGTYTPTSARVYRITLYGVSF